MNRTYRSVWNESAGAWMAVQENARGRGKGKARAGVVQAMKAAALLGLGALALSAQAAETPVEESGVPAGSTVTDPVADARDAALRTLLSAAVLGVPESAFGTSPAVSRAGLLAASDSTAGSGVDTSGLTRTYDTAAYYSQVGGYANNVALTPPTDRAMVGPGAVAIGSNTIARAAASTAVGVQAYASANDAVALGSGSVANQANTVSVGNDGTTSRTAMDANGQPYTLANPANTRRIVNMAAGQADTDAVNAGQLRAVASALGGGAGVNDDGTIIRPGYALRAGTFADVGAALQAVDHAAAADFADSVKYDTSAHMRVTLDGGANGTVLSNVANGVADRDAVNLAQLKAAGLNVDTGGNVMNAFVAYDDATKSTVTLGGANGTRITNLAAGAVTASSADAVNGAQLYRGLSGAAFALGGGAAVDTDGSLKGPSYVIGGSTYGDVGSALKAMDNTATTGLADSVKYDTSAHARVTLDGGANGTVLSNVANGAADRDAVNLAQLKAAGLNVDTGGNVTNAFVAYDDATRSIVTLGGANGTKITNLAAGTANSDAVNAGQLSALAATLGGGAGIAADGTIAAPAYHMQGGTQRTVGGALDTLDSGLTSLQQQIAGSGLDLVAQDPVSRAISVGANTNGTVVSFAGTAGNRTLTGVAAGAVNAASAEAINGAQLYASTASTAAALGGGASVRADGTLAAPTYTIGGATLNNVGAALTNLDGRVTQNTTQITNLQQTITNIAGSLANAVQYDSSAHDKVTLGGTDAAGAVRLSNLADALLGATSTDAVTGAQLYATNVQVASIEQAIQNVSTSQTPYVAVSSPNGPATATGANTLAVGGGALASGTSSTALGDRAQASATNAVALGANSVADRNDSVSVGSAGHERQITNVAAGTAPTDAVNLGQLNSAMGGVNNRIDDVDHSARRGIAAASALNIVTPYLPGRTTLNAGVATYRGQAALGIGVSRWNAKGSVNYNLGVSSAGGNSTIVRAGIGIVFGS
ncbi:ESPR-type extended signal peptide-containing protein [Paraburkholderia sp. J63]|uniref:ESPR-type extended signal peptide-containing protein n=1 Tax=Paraburkholderia sp. J63 TaxID=2805434 RepID=UPI002ABDEBA2|nr:ESPR-type extended signal peptide-containing protein [Paraburkholderia sp. J63]